MLITSPSRECLETCTASPRQPSWLSSRSKKNLISSNLTFNVQVIEQESVKGFPEVVVGTNVSDCISHVIQVDVTSLPKDIFEYGEDFKIFGQSIQFLLVYSGHKLIQTKLSCSHEVCLFSRESFSSHKFCVLQPLYIYLNPCLKIPCHLIINMCQYNRP